MRGKHSHCLATQSSILLAQAGPTCQRGPKQTDSLWKRLGGERDEARWPEGQQEGKKGSRIRLMAGLTKALGWGQQQREQSSPLA